MCFIWKRMQSHCCRSVSICDSRSWSNRFINSDAKLLTTNVGRWCNLSQAKRNRSGLRVCRVNLYILSRGRIINRCIINATFTDIPVKPWQQSFVSLHMHSPTCIPWISQRRYVVTVCYGLQVKPILLNLKWNCCRRRDRCFHAKPGEKYLSVKYVISAGKYSIDI